MSYNIAEVYNDFINDNNFNQHSLTNSEII